MEWGNLRNWVSTNPRSRELWETRQTWEQIEALWRASPLATNGPYELALALVQEVMRRADRIPALAILVAFADAAEALFGAEDIVALEAEWPLIESDLAVAANFRKMMARRRRWVSNFVRIHGIVRERLIGGYLALIDRLPEPCFGDWDGDTQAFSVPLAELLEDTAVAVEGLILLAYDDDTLELDLFLRLRHAFERNLLIASGFPPNDDPKRHEQKLVVPTRLKGRSPADLAELYLAGTPFAGLMELPVPFQLPDEARFEHCHIVGGTGHGKTQLMQRMIHADLVAAQRERRSVVVIDSQGDLINKLVRLDLFSPDNPEGLADRLILIDPADVEFPAALNLFDAHLDRLRDYRPVDRERVLNGVVELYEVFFGALLGAELTQKQGVIFKYLARLMLAIPGATIHTLMRLMEDGKPFKSYMDQLEGSARYFFQSEFFHPSFAATKKQILRRLWGVLSTPAFERMFAQPTNKLDLFEALNSGKIILLNTAKDLLKQEGSQLFGRFFIALLTQAALERSTLAPDDRTPSFVYVDEAQEYFDDSIETILNQARKYRVGLILAHQTLDQLSPRLRAALHANTSLKCAGGVSARDARALADELHTTAEFIESMRRRGGRSEFAVWLKHTTPHAIRLSIPLGFLERQSVLTEEAFDELMDANRVRYCGTLDTTLALTAAPSPQPAEDPPPAVRAPEPRSTSPGPPAPEGPAPASPTPTEVPAAAAATEDLTSVNLEPAPRSPEAAPAPTPPRAPMVTREFGKGGPKHRYLQTLVKELGEQQGFRATIEAPLAGGSGQVDVLLERDGLAVAVEVSVTTPVEHERENVRKCLNAGYARVALVLAKSRNTQGRYKAMIQEGLSDAERERTAFLAPEDVADFIAALAAPPEPSESIVRGYRVKLTHTAVSPEEAKARRSALARVVARSLKQMKD